MLRGFCHAAVAILGWILFFSWWIRVLASAGPSDIAIALLFIALTLAVTVAVTLIWVRYNIGIYRRKGPRRNVTAVDENRDADVLGRRIEGPGTEALKRAPVVSVSLENGAKRFDAAEL
jgi:hypothetical protein